MEKIVILKINISYKNKYGGKVKWKKLKMFVKLFLK
jgi:hypothetical protein